MPDTARGWDLKEALAKASDTLPVHEMLLCTRNQQILMCEQLLVDNAALVADPYCYVIKMTEDQLREHVHTNMQQLFLVVRQQQVAIDSLTRDLAAMVAQRMEGWPSTSSGTYKAFYLKSTNAANPTKTQPRSREIDRGTEEFLDAVCRNDATTVQHLLELCGNLVATGRGEFGRGAGHMCARLNCQYILQIVLRTGVVHVDAVDVAGCTALHLACNAGHLNIVEALVKNHGANVDALDNYKRTPLHYAVEGKRMHVVESLLTKLGADRSARDADGFTPKRLAERMWTRFDVTIFLRRTQWDS